MVERVAAAIAKLGADGCEVTDGGGSIAACVGPCRCREFARAAIQAMREPTWKMKEAGADSYGQGRSWTGTWQAMIDAALKEAGHD